MSVALLTTKQHAGLFLSKQSRHFAKINIDKAFPLYVLLFQYQLQETKTINSRTLSTHHTSTAHPTLTLTPSPPHHQKSAITRLSSFPSTTNPRAVTCCLCKINVARGTRGPGSRHSTLCIGPRAANARKHVSSPMDIACTWGVELVGLVLEGYIARQL